MSIQTTTNRFIVSPLQTVRVKLYQHLFSSVVNFQELGNRLTRYAEQVQAFRYVEHVEEAGQLLANLPLKDYKTISQYYLAWCAYKRNIDVRKTFEHIAESGPLNYRARALQTLAAIESRKQDYHSELRWLIESLKVYPSAEALRGIAIVKAKEGYSRKALSDLESLLPLVKTSPPIVFYSWLNSLATELGETGRKEEARNISRIVLSSPFAYAYPEWQETANGLRGSRKSFVSINSSHYLPSNVFLMPVIRREEIATRLAEPARVLDLQKWKKKMVKCKQENSYEQRHDEQRAVEEMRTSDMLRRAMQVFSDRAIPEQKRREMMKAIERILAGPAKPEPDKPKPDNTGRA